MFQANLQALQPPFPNLLQNPLLTRTATPPRCMHEPHIEPQHPQIRKIMKQAAQARDMAFIPVPSENGRLLDDLEFRDKVSRGRGWIGICVFRGAGWVLGRFWVLLWLGGLMGATCVPIADARRRSSVRRRLYGARVGGRRSGCFVCRRKGAKCLVV